jgi:hypothetical protein
MNLLNNITADPNQELPVTLDDGSTAVINLVYRPTIQRWIMDVTYNNMIVDGINLCVYPNVLRQWKNLLPFGIACVAADGIDPISIDDFANGRASLYILNADDVVTFEAQL